MAPIDPYDKCARCDHRKSQHPRHKGGRCTCRKLNRESGGIVTCDCPAFIPKDEAWRLESDATSVTKKWR